MTVTPYTLAEVADVLRYEGADQARSVRRAFEKHGISIIRRDYKTWLVLPNQLTALLEAMTCSLSENEADIFTSVVRSESVKRSVSSKSTLREAIAAKLPKPTGRSSSTNYPSKSFTVIQGGSRA